jgi:ferrous iron transport protein B
MWDRVERSGVVVDTRLLSTLLGVPVVTTTANRRVGIEPTKAALRELAIAPFTKNCGELFPEAFRREIHQLSQWITGQGFMIRRYLVERMVLDEEGLLEERWRRKRRLEELPQRLHAARRALTDADCRPPFIETKVRHGWVQSIVQQVVRRAEAYQLSLSDRVDRVLAHRWWGLAIFLGWMFLLFQGLFLWDLGEYSLTAMIEAGLGRASLGVESILPPGALRSLINDGLIAGVGGVLTFVPQIALLFLLVAVMEDCGYMARVALVMDRIMLRLGLNGKAFLPLMTSFGCAVPGIMAARTIESTRDRMVTILIAPLMSCSARLPVYTLLITTFVPTTRYLGGWVSLRGLFFLGMYALGILIAIPVAWILKRYFFPGQPSAFVIELPSYSWPSWRVVLHRVWEQVYSFLTRAGTLILCTSAVLWAAAYFPGDHRREGELASLLEATDAVRNPARSDELEQELNRERGRLIEASFLGSFGKAIEPIFMAVGWDWKIGVGVLASFPAREVVIATLGTIYSLGGDCDEGSDTLQSQLLAARWPDGRPIFHLFTALSLMVFFALCAQCAATLMTIYQESGGWRWPLFTFVYMTGLAYVGAWLVYQLGRLVGAGG